MLGTKTHVIENSIGEAQTTDVTMKSLKEHYEQLLIQTRLEYRYTGDYTER